MQKLDVSYEYYCCVSCICKTVRNEAYRSREWTGASSAAVTEEAEIGHH